MYVAKSKNVFDMMTKQCNWPQFKAYRNFVLDYTDDVPRLWRLHRLQEKPFAVTVYGVVVDSAGVSLE
jgi:hypothetical protein